MNRFFWIRALTFLSIIILLICYQYKALKWEKIENDNKSEIAAVEKYNRRIRKENEKAVGKEILYTYNNGTFEGSAKGFGGDIVVEVEMKEDEILSVNIKKAEGEDASYLSMAKELIKNIVDQQNADVDTISGATYSSKGIINATKTALENAKNNRKDS